MVRLQLEYIHHNRVGCMTPPTAQLRHIINYAKEKKRAWTSLPLCTPFPPPLSQILASYSCSANQNESKTNREENLDKFQIPNSDPARHETPRMATISTENGNTRILFGDPAQDSLCNHPTKYNCRKEYKNKVNRRSSSKPKTSNQEAQLSPRRRRGVEANPAAGPCRRRCAVPSPPPKSKENIEDQSTPALPQR